MPQLRKKILNKLLKQILSLIDEVSLSPEEAGILCGNIGWSIGAALAGRSRDPPSIEELEKAYYSGPSMPVYLMLMGLNTAAVCKQENEKENKSK